MQFSLDPIREYFPSTQWVLGAPTTEKIDYSKPDSTGYYPIHFAAKRGKISEVEKSLRQNPRLVNVQTPEGWSPLHLAAMEGHAEMVFLLLVKGALNGLTDQQGRSPLFFAKNADIVNILAQSGSNLRLKDKFGLTPYHAFIEKGRPDATRNLQKHEFKGRYKPVKLIKSEDGHQIEALYDAESTDLYPLQSPWLVRAKSIVTIAATPLQLIKSMFRNTIKIVHDMGRSIYSVFEHLSERGAVHSMSDLAKKICVEIPKNIVWRIVRVCRAPLMAVAMVFCAVLGIIAPMKGQELMNRVELLWDEPGLLNFTGLEKFGRLSHSTKEGIAEFLIHI